MVEMFEYAFMQRALLAGVLVGTVCAVVGVYVVLRGMSFMGAGISHTSLGGVAIGVWLGIDPIVSAAVFSVLAGWAIAGASRKGWLKEDTAIGILFATGMAVGVLLISLRQEYQADLLSYLFGSITAVGSSDLVTAAVSSALVIGCVAVLFKDLMLVVFDPEMAEVAGLPAGPLYFLLVAMIALTVVMSIKVVGIVLVSALIVIPAAAAYQLTENFRTMMAVSVAIGVGSTTAGLIASYELGSAAGATIVLLAALVFLVCAAASPRRRRSRRARASGANGS